MERTLEMRFYTAENEKVMLSVPSAKEDLTDQQVATAMDNILSEGIFTSKSGDLVKKADAKIVTKTTKDITLA
jgi:hypothetical protein